MGIFCLVGPLVTLITGWAMVVFARQICSIRSAVVRTVAWYTSLTMLLLDPLYLSLFYRWVGGGDMNGIALIVPTTVASIVAAVAGVVNIILIWKVLYPTYLQSFVTVQDKE